MYLIVTATVAVIMIAYVLLNKLKGGKAKAKYTKIKAHTSVSFSLTD